jgi:Ran GTPase-activating protein (RanGAP) involved in mRNA processing and transport
MKREYPEFCHLEVDENSKQLLYDDAVNFLKKSCQDIEFEEINSLKFHANTWGLSSSNYFKDDILSKMINLKKLDLSDTLKCRQRSDLCMSIKALLSVVKDIDTLDLSENFLDTDGARAFVDFLSTNSTLKVFKINGCKLNDESLEMMFEAISKNPKL